MYILNIETSTKNCSVSLAKQGETIAIRELADEGYSHAEFLHVFIEQIIAEASIKFHDLSAIAVSKGPGSYTGLRIGVSAAKGLCYALEIPLIAIDTLLLLAKTIAVKSGVIVPMIDARRMEVYTAVFDQDYHIVEATSAKILDENSYNNLVSEIHIVGDCQEKAATVLTNSNFIFHTEKKFPSSADMSFLSYQKFLNNEFENVAYFEPLYLKEFYAPIKN